MNQRPAVLAAATNLVLNHKFWYPLQPRDSARMLASLGFSPSSITGEATSGEAQYIYNGSSSAFIGGLSYLSGTPRNTWIPIRPI